MTQRAVKTVQEFEFRADFGPQELRLVPEPEPAPAPPPAPEPAEGQITLTGPELAMLLSEARAEGLAEGRQKTAAQEHERLQLVTGKLNQALANLVALAGHLEATAYDSDMSETSIRLINATAKRIIDGQGDMFAVLAAAETPTGDET